MKSFIKKISVFSLWFLLFCSIVLVLIKSSHEFLPSEMYYSNEFKNAFKEKDIELIAIGNSKLLSSIDKNILQNELGLKSAILGYQSANISISRLILESYLNKSIRKPKMVILEVSWFTFNTSRTHFHNISGDLFLNDIKLWTKIGRYYPEIIDKVKIGTARQLLAKIIPFQSISYASIFQEKSPKTKNYDFSLVSFEKRFPNHKAGIDNLLLDDYYSIVKMCQINDIELILYTAPEDEDYTSYQKDKDKIKNIFRQTSGIGQVFFFL